MPAADPPPTDTSARKAWWRSKTLWFNALVAAAATAEASFNVLQPALPVNVYAVLSFSLTLGNVLLRLVTTQGLKP